MWSALPQEVLAYISLAYVVADAKHDDICMTSQQLIIIAIVLSR